MSKKNEYTVFGADWLHPILEIERQQELSNNESIEADAKPNLASRCDKTIDMFLELKSHNGEDE